MKYKTHNQKEIGIIGTHAQGEIDCSYKDVVNAFGKPSKRGDNYKTDANWNIEFEDGTIATIYNYKDGKNYNGRSGTATTKIRDWHIGGHEPVCVDLVKLAIIEAKP